MAKAGREKSVSFSLWSGGGCFAASRPDGHFNLTFNDPVPLRHWRPNYRFIGLSDPRLYFLSRGAFPRKVEPKTRPLHSLGGLPHNVAYKVCPCSSKRPFDMRRVRYVRAGCRLLHSNAVVDRNSYLIENVTLNIPSSMYRELKFRGEVPEECIETNFRPPSSTKIG
jgi:hypothetical protein